MAVTETRNLPAQFIEDLGKDYAKQLTATTAIPIDTSKFAPSITIAGLLPPNSSVIGVKFFEAASITFFPIFSPPVKKT